MARRNVDRRLERLEDRIVANESRFGIIDNHIGKTDNRVTSLETKLEMFIEEMRIQNQAADKRMTKIESKLDSISRHVQILSATVVVGMVATIISVGAMVYAVLTR